MSSNNSKLLQLFESEVWLYLAHELDDSRIKFWDEQISQSSDLKRLLNETKQLLNIYESETLADIDNLIFDKMIQQATKPGVLIKLKNLFNSNDEQGFNIPKLALATTLSIAAIIMLLFNDKPNQVKNISNELLDWEAGSITQQMNEIETGISMVEKDNYKRYMIMKLRDEKWNKNIYSISKDLEKLNNELNEISM